MGEETDGAIESVSKLQAKIKALSGVNILTESGDYKDTYTILREIGEVWENMSDIDQAALLELMAGKNRANTLSAILSNMTDLEGAYNDALKAEGSALKENEAYLDSIQGRIDLFNNAVQTMWMNFISSDAVKFIVNLGTGLIKLVDTIGMLPTAAGLFAGWKFAAKELEKAFGKTGVSAKEARKIITDYIMQEKEAAMASQEVTTAKQQEAAAETQAAAAAEKEAVASKNAATADKAEAASSSSAASADQLEGQMSLFAAEADDIEASSSTNAKNADDAEAGSSANAAAADQLEGQMSLFDGDLQAVSIGGNKQPSTDNLGAKVVKETTEEAVESGVGLVGILGKVGTGIKAIGLAAGKAILVMAAIKVATYALGKAWEWLDNEVIHRAEHIKEEVENLKTEYESTQETLESNIKTLTTSGDTKLYATLEDEFKTLAAGVDKYGNNISLTSDQYERYKAICDQIVGINPRIAAGYKSSTEAIGNNVDILTELINLQKIQARQNVDKLISDENFGKLTEDANNDLQQATFDFSKNKAVAASNVWGKLSKAVSGNLPVEYRGDNYLKTATSDLNSNSTTIDETMAYILKQIGYAEDKIQSELSKYEQKSPYGTTFLTNQFALDHYDEIINNIDKFSAEYRNELNGALTDVENAIRDGGEDINKAQDGLVDDFLLVTQGSEIGDAYEGLNAASRDFVTSWIKNSSLFKLDSNKTTEQANNNKQTLIDMVNDLASGEMKIDFEGQQITGQDFLDQMYNFDPTGINWAQYKEKMQAFLDAFWNAIGGDTSAYGVTQQTLAVMFGLEFIGNESIKDGEQEQLRKQVGAWVNMSAEEIQEWLDSLPPEKVKAFYTIEWNKVDNPNQRFNTTGDLEREMDKQIVIQNSTNPKTYSELSSSVGSFDSIQQQTNEILHNGVQITQEYKNALVDLGISTEDINACLDENTQLIVENATGLKFLVEKAKANAAANLKLAKSNARLQYDRLVGELNDVLSANKELDGSSMLVVNAILSQIDAVDQAIYKYTLLEDQLLGTHNAFDKFKQAQEVDSLNTYGDDYVSMVQSIYDAYTKTGEVGTETVQAAIDAAIPKDALKGLEKGSSEYNQAVYDYLQNNLVTSLTLDGDSLSLDFDSIEKFVTENLGTLFDGTSIDNFSLVDRMDLEKAVELTGKTEAQLYAMFAALKDFTGVDYLSLLDDSTEVEITRTNQQLEELNRRKLELLQDGGTENHAEELTNINSEIESLLGNLESLKKDAFEDLSNYEFNSGLMGQLSEIGDMSAATGEKLQSVKSAFTEQHDAMDFEATMGVNLDEASAQQVFDYLLAKQMELEEPTVVTVQYAIEYQQGRIEYLTEKLGYLNTLNTNSRINNTVTIDGVDMDVAAIQAEIDAAKAKIADWEIKYKVIEETSVMDEMTAINEYNIAGKHFTISATDSASSKIQNVINKLQSLKDAGIAIDALVTFKPVAAKANGTAHVLGTAFKTGSWGATRTETALVGELGPEMLVRDGRWTTIGDNGAEFTHIRRGDIIFNHKQTEDLLSKGYVTGRGRMVGGAFASGTDYDSLWRPVKGNQGFSTHGSSSGADDDFNEIFDWFEVLLEEINEQLDLMNAKLENAVGISAKGSLIDELLSVNKYKIVELAEGIELYTDYANKLLTKVPEQYRQMVQDGAVEITEFLGEANEETLEAINNYREWAQKVADLNQQLEETNKEIADLAKQKFDVVADEYENILDILEAQRDQFDAQISLMEDRGYVASTAYYEAMIENTRKQSEELEKEKTALQEVLDEQVRLGNIKVGSEQWYEMVSALYDVDASIKDCVSDLESYQNAINDIYWDNFENLTNRLDYLKNETKSLIDLMDSEDMVITPETEDGWSADAVEWSKEGLASLGLYAQQMEIAEYTARKYDEAIDDLNNDFKAGKYSESEYHEKLEELTSAQYDSIEAYYDAQEAIKNLQKARVDAIKEGIEKEIDAYDKLIQKKKEELSADKDMHDFQKSIAEKNKEISDIERKLAALSADNSISAVAKRKELEAELAKAKADLEEQYYDRSVTDQQEALDRELESYKEEKDKEIEKLEEYLEDVKTVVADSLLIIKDNASGIYDALMDKADEYNLTLSDTIVSPWQDGALAVSDYQTAFDTAMSSTTSQLEEMNNQWQELIDKMSTAAGVEIESQAKENNRYVEATPVPTTSTKETTSNKAITVGGKINAGSATIYTDSDGRGASTQYYSSDPIYTVLDEKNGYVLVRHHSLSSGYSGWFKKSSVKAYAKGTTGTKRDELAWIDELGDELVMHANGNGKLSFLSKGTAVIPHDISENLMALGQLDPSDVLSRNTPVISANPNIVTNNMEINMEIAEVVHVDTVTNETMPDLTKAVEKQLDKYMKNINNNIRKYTR
jgi:hypothetical protein